MAFETNIIHIYCFYVQYSVLLHTPFFEIFSMCLVYFLLHQCICFSKQYISISACLPINARSVVQFLMDYTMGWNLGQGNWDLRVIVLYNHIDDCSAKHSRKILAEIRKWLV